MQCTNHHPTWYYYTWIDPSIPNPCTLLVADLPVESMSRALVSSRVVIHYEIDASISSSHDRKAYISTYSSFGDNPPPGRKYQPWQSE